LGVTVGRLKEGLNRFYEDFKSLQIKITEAIHLVKRQINGASNKEIEAITLFLRSPDKDHQKLIYQDKDGETIQPQFP